MEPGNDFVPNVTDEKEVAKTGWLQKQGEKGIGILDTQGIRSWKKRWFRLEGGKLHYSKKEKVCSL